MGCWLREASDLTADFSYINRMRIVGKFQRTELEFDPARAIERAMLWRPDQNPGTIPHPKGVFRGTHAYFNALDYERSLAQARLLNKPLNLS